MSQTITYTYAEAMMPGFPNTITRSTDNAIIPCDLHNMDYQAFLEWIAAGNEAPAGWTGPQNPT
jgi:hypothetical protein